MSLMFAQSVQEVANHPIVAATMEALAGTSQNSEPHDLNRWCQPEENTRNAYFYPQDLGSSHGAQSFAFIEVFGNRLNNLNSQPSLQDQASSTFASEGKELCESLRPAVQALTKLGFRKRKAGSAENKNGLVDTVVMTIAANPNKETSPEAIRVTLIES